MITKRFNWVLEGILSGKYDIEDLLKHNKYMLWEIFDYFVLKNAKVENSQDKIKISLTLKNHKITYILEDLISYLRIESQGQIIEDKVKEQGNRIKEVLLEKGLL